MTTVGNAAVLKLVWFISNKRPLYYYKSKKDKNVKIMDVMVKPPPPLKLFAPLVGSLYDIDQQAAGPGSPCNTTHRTKKGFCQFKCFEIHILNSYKTTQKILQKPKCYKKFVALQRDQSCRFPLIPLFSCDRIRELVSDQLL